MTKALDIDTGLTFQKILASSHISEHKSPDHIFSPRQDQSDLLFLFYLHSAISDPARNHRETTPIPNDPTGCNFYHREVPRVSEPKRIKRSDLYSSIRTEGKIG